MSEKYSDLMPKIEAEEKLAGARASEPADTEGGESDPFFYPMELMLSHPGAADTLQALHAGPAFAAVSSYQEEFKAFMADLNLRHFSSSEFLYLGGGHHSTGACRGLNGFPPKSRWPKIRKTAQVLDEIRERLGAPVTLLSIYRNPPYNSCVGGVSGSLHKRFNAADFRCQDGNSSGHWAATARTLRNEGFFRGGIGIYTSFVHVDTRGVNKDWDNR